MNDVGIPEMLNRDTSDVIVSDSFSNLFILDKQHDNILAHIHKSYVPLSEHEQDLPSGIGLLTFTALDHKRYSEFLGKRNGIIAPGEDGKLLEFRIFRAEKYRNLEGIRLVDIHAHASYLDLINAKVIQPFKSNPETAEWHANNALSGTEVKVGNIEYKGAKRIEFRDATNPYEYLKRVAKEFELELDFYVKTKGTKIIRYVDMVEQVGERRGRIVEFGRDLKSIRRVEDTQNIVTALVGYGPEDEEGNRISVFVEDKDALERWGRNGQHIVDVYYPQSERIDMTEDELRQYTKTELNKRISETVTYEGEIVDLEHMPGLDNKKIRFGDTIGVKDTYFNPPLYLEARIFNQKRDVFNRTPKEFKLGDYREFTEDEVHEFWNQIRDEINRRMDRLAIVSITSSAGNIFKNAEGTTELTARTFVSGSERDKDGTLYDYQWMRFDKEGNHDTNFYEQGKTITVTSNDIDEKATYRVLVAYELEVINTNEITISNVYDGSDGQPGRDGNDGVSSYTHIRYSVNADGTNMGNNPSNAIYIGIAITNSPTAPTNKNDYEWSKIKGDDGVPGEKGEDGKTSYVHIKYSDDGGLTFTSNNGEDPGAWIGTYTDFTQADSNDVNDYTWVKVKGEDGEKGDKGDKGEQGPPGIPGPPGNDGESQYIHIRYSVNADGNPMTTNPQSNSKYIGLANTTSPTAPSNYTAYSWALIKGEDGQDGIPGPPGEDGETTYTWVRYADDENGSGMSDNPAGKLYIGLAFNKTTPTESDNPSDYNWSLIKGEDGRAVENVTEYFLIASVSEGITRNASGWTTTMQVPTKSRPYLWAYSEIKWSKAPLITYVEPHVIGTLGEDGPPGADGPPGDDGRSVDDIVIEYYKSISKSSQIGGSWTEIKPVYQYGYYLWTRSKITYSNPIGTEYTTPVLDDSWEALMPDTNYNGLEWSPSDGLIVERDDGKVRTAISGTDGLKIQQKVGSAWTDMFYTDIDGNANFSGNIRGSNISGSLFASAGLDENNHNVNMVLDEGYLYFRSYDSNTQDYRYHTTYGPKGINFNSRFYEEFKINASGVNINGSYFSGSVVSLHTGSIDDFIFTTYESFRHRNIKMGNVSITGLNSSLSELQVRNADNTEYAQMAASSFLTPDGLADIIDSSGNGWIRYANGIQICWFTDSDSVSTSSVLNGTYYASKTFFFPRPFISKPTVNPISERVSGIQWAGLRSASSVSCDIYILSSGTGAYGRLGYISVGRWK